MNNDRLDRLKNLAVDLRAASAELEDIIEAEGSHNTAVRKDAREKLTRGDTFEVVIEDPSGESGPDAVSRIDGIVTFVKPGQHRLKAGTTAHVKLTDVGENQAHAVVTKLPEVDDD